MSRPLAARAVGLLWALAGLAAQAAQGAPDAAAAARTASAAPVRVPDTLAQRLAPCTACHGAEGRAGREGYLPRIAGKPAGYLFHQLLNFRDGRRSNPAMAGLLAHQQDAYLREIAGHFAALDLPYAAPPRTPVPAAMLARGQALARQGDAARRIPACTACHGVALTGTQPATPGLLGLPRDYLIAQFGAWKTGTRRAIAPDCMAEISHRLGTEDIGALAGWLAAQAVPTPATPQPAATTPPPLPCGSVATPLR